MARINLLYYKNILDVVLARFVRDNNNLFVKEGDSYILGSDTAYSSMKKTLTLYIVDELKNYISPFSLENRDYYFIIGSCNPCDNILLKFKDDRYFPEKLTRLINSDYPVKYVLKEKDIKLNLVRMNQIFVEIFNDFFSSRRKVSKMFGKDYGNLFFIQHRILDCYSMFKIIKKVYGRTNCLNMHKEYMKDMFEPIISVNDLICKYINNKKELLRSRDFENVSLEIKEFMDGCMNACMLSA